MGKISSYKRRLYSLLIQTYWLFI